MLEFETLDCQSEDGNRKEEEECEGTRDGRGKNDKELVRKKIHLIPIFLISSLTLLQSFLILLFILLLTSFLIFSSPFHYTSLSPLSVLSHPFCSPRPPPFPSFTPGKAIVVNFGGSCSLKWRIVVGSLRGSRGKCL